MERKRPSGSLGPADGATVMTTLRLGDFGGHSVHGQGSVAGGDGGAAGCRERAVEGHEHDEWSASATVEGCGVYAKKGMAVTSCHSAEKTSLELMIAKSRPEDQKALEFGSEEGFPAGRDGVSTACSSGAYPGHSEASPVCTVSGM